MVTGLLPHSWDCPLPCFLPPPWWPAVSFRPLRGVGLAFSSPGSPDPSLATCSHFSDIHGLPGLASVDTVWEASGVRDGEKSMSLTSYKENGSCQKHDQSGGCSQVCKLWNSSHSSVSSMTVKIWQSFHPDWTLKLRWVKIACQGSSPSTTTNQGVISLHLSFLTGKWE